MKTLAPAAKAAIEAGEAIVTGAVQISPRGGGTPIRIWGGYGPITPPTLGVQFKGVGDRAIAQQTSNAIGGVAQGMTLSLSGVEANALALLDASEVKAATVTVYRLIFASDGKTLLDAHVFDRGRMDTVDTDETIGDQAAIVANVESSARGLGRSGARMRADSDQRLISSTDGYFKNTAYAGQKMLYWGGKKPTTGSTAVSSPPTGSFGS